jgi:hypothetical protein
MGPSSGLSTKSPSAPKTAEDNFLDVLKNTFVQEKSKLTEIGPGVFYPNPYGKGFIA